MCTKIRLDDSFPFFCSLSGSRMQLELSLRCELAIKDDGANRDTGDTWQNEHLTLDDELELELNSVFTCVVGV